MDTNNNKKKELIPLDFPNDTPTLDKKMLAYRIFILKCDGYTIFEISKFLDIPYSRTRKLLTQHIQRRERPEKVEELRAEHRTNLNHWLLKLKPGIELGDPQSIQTAVRISESLRRLDAIDENIDPQKQDAPNTTDLQKAIDAARQKRAEQVPPQTQTQTIKDISQ